MATITGTMETTFSAAPMMQIASTDLVVTTRSKATAEQTGSTV